MPVLGFPLAAPLGGDSCEGVIALDVNYFLALWERLYPESYLSPLKSPGPGYELLRAFARLGERLSLAAARIDCGNHILQATGGNRATTTLRLSRPDLTTGAITVRAGSIVKTTSGDRRFETLQDAVFGASDLGPIDVPARALEAAYEFNLPGDRTAADGEALPGEIDAARTLRLDPVYPATGVPNFVVDQPYDSEGGRPAALDALGRDRGLPRGLGESDAAYRARIRQLPDTVSPGAIRRALQRYLTPFLAPFGGTYDFVETFSRSYQTAYDCPSPNVGTPSYAASTPPGLDENLFAYDDPRPAWPPFRNRWLDEEDFRAAFVVTVPNLPAMADVGLAYDDVDADSPSALQTALGARAVNAYDVPSTLDHGELQGAYDGFDLPKRSVYRGLADLLAQIKAGGVLAVVELQGQ